MAFWSRQFKSSFIKNLMAFVFSFTTVFPYISYASADQHFANTIKKVKECKASKTELIGSSCNKNSPKLTADGEVIKNKKITEHGTGTTSGKETAEVAKEASGEVNDSQAACERSMWSCTESCKADVEKAAAEDLKTCETAAEAECAPKGPQAKACEKPLKMACEEKKEELTKKGDTALAACKVNRTAFAGIAAALLAGLAAMALSGMQQKQGTENKQQDQQQNQNQNNNPAQTTAADKTCSAGGGLACICKTNPSSDKRCGKCWNADTRQLIAGCKLDDGTTVGGAATGDAKTSAATPSSPGAQSTTVTYNTLKQKQTEGDLGKGSNTGGATAAKATGVGRSLDFEDRMINGMSIDGKKSSDVAGEGDYSTAASESSDVAGQDSSGGYSYSRSFDASKNPELARSFPGRPDLARASASEEPSEEDRAQVAPMASNIWANLSRAYKKANLIEHQ
ncbi:MAG: hypothetical protein AB7H97_04575 [Pseudobdellovibrionaceae bacterium]